MADSEAREALEDLVSAIQRLIQTWNERSPAILASSLQDCSLPVLLELLTRLDEPPQPVMQAIAKMLLARYVREDLDLDIFRAELWSLVNAQDLQWALRDVLLALIEIASQQPLSHPNYQHYQTLKALSEEALQEIEGPLTAYPRRQRKRRYRVSLARTAELPDLSALTFDPVDFQMPAQESDPAQRRTGTLTQLPTFVALPQPRRLSNDWVVNWHELALDAPQTALLLDHLPELYAQLEHWDYQESPYELAEWLHNRSLEEALELSGALLPHREQEHYLRYLSIWVHLKLLQEKLPVLPEVLRRLFGDSREHIKGLLPALGYYIYCSAHSFTGIQQEALKQLDSQQGYLYHLIMDEWAKNKRIRTFMAGWLPRKEQSAVKLLATADWEFVFFLLNRGWARSVIRDVYGVFHGSSAFSNQIVQPDTSRGFGNLQESSGVSFLATRQISDLLRKQPVVVQNEQLRLQQFEQFVADRFRKDVLRKEQRPSLNAPTLKRIERFARSLQQRAEQQQLPLLQAVRLGTDIVLQHYMYLSTERLEWLGYELTLIWLGAAPEPMASDQILRGLLQAITSETIRTLPQRQQASGVLEALLNSLCQATLDHAVLTQMPPDLLREQPQRLVAILQTEAPKALLPHYRQHLNSLSPSLGHKLGASLQP